ncbi:hypothetical protein [Neorhodopirellula pilleata]|uniref:Uncharacterized protein n=1 Tax=Neorhodopirellula pilleata TaxID=2714738 RepID=A0A5C6AH08_9BACT|nr:hypothetical protein [Neorhodopirellula pilleata]TWT98727.1 hypothetical protein Pla100_18920 [Neorhodopirellula pilleata]
MSFTLPSINTLFRSRHLVSLVLIAWTLSVLPSTSADEPTASETPKVETPKVETPSDDGNTDESRPKRIAEYLTGATFTGQFTVAGKSDTKPESYTISSCEPLGHDDLYRLKVKIRYGDVDGEFPMDLKILWSGNTPVITMDAIWIPGLGTFSARVLIHQDRYAGTWQHDDKGGHLFGTIEKNARPNARPND